MEAARISVDEARRRMDSGEPITFVDTRNPQAWAQSRQKLPGAVRVPVDEVDQHASQLPRDRAIVTYCT